MIPATIAKSEIGIIVKESKKEKCNYCHDIINSPNGGTSNMIHHLLTGSRKIGSITKATHTEALKFDTI